MEHSPPKDNGPLHTIQLVGTLPLTAVSWSETMPPHEESSLYDDDKICTAALDSSANAHLFVSARSFVPSEYCSTSPAISHSNYSIAAQPTKHLRIPRAARDSHFRATYRCPSECLASSGFSYARGFRHALHESLQPLLRPETSTINQCTQAALGTCRHLTFKQIVSSYLQKSCCTLWPTSIALHRPTNFGGRRLDKQTICSERPRRVIVIPRGPCDDSNPHFEVECMTGCVGGPPAPRSDATIHKSTLEHESSADIAPPTYQPEIECLGPCFVPGYLNECSTLLLRESRGPGTEESTAADISATLSAISSVDTTAWAWGFATMIVIHISGGISGAH
ncbi:hypothetical protein DOTSEDRAFT_74082, partial [Dothistroma septosporum NZE10]